MFKKLLLVVSLTTLIAGSAVADSQTRRIMHNVADSLGVLLPLSLDSDKFLSPSNRQVVEANLAKLESSADALARHGASGSLDFELLASAFARSVTRLRKDYRYKNPADARYLLTDLTQHCVACHSREPTTRDFPLSAALNKYLQEESPAGPERARLQVALRQFRGAMQTWETVLLDPSVQPVEMAVDGDFVEYLTIAVRVEQEYDRAAQVLRKVAARDDVPFYLRRKLKTWIGDLESMQPHRGQAISMEEARRIFTRPEKHPGLLSDDSNLISDLALSASLRRMVESGKNDPPEQLAEAYYMLGVIDARTVGVYSALPTMERFWEAAIRTAPHSHYAVESYALLEEYAATTYSGDLPFERTSDMFAHLAKLRAMMGLK